jgi:hypothetical protein
LIRDGFENLGVARTLQIEIDFDSDALEFLAAACMDEGKGIDENQECIHTVLRRGEGQTLLLGR